MRDIPYLVIIDNLESEKDWWDKRVITDLLPQFGGETHFIITTRLSRVMNLEPMKLSYLSGAEAMTLMKGGVKEYPLMEIDALKVIEEKLGRLTLGLAIVGAILLELPITPSRLLDTLNRPLPVRDFSWNEREVSSLKNNAALVRLLYGNQGPLSQLSAARTLHAVTKIQHAQREHCHLLMTWCQS